MLSTCFVVRYAYFNAIINVLSLYNIVNDKNMYAMLMIQLKNTTVMLVSWLYHDNKVIIFAKNRTRYDTIQ